MYKKRKIIITPSYCTSNGIYLLVRDNRQVYMSGLTYSDFILMDKNGNIFNPYACIESDIPGYYELMFLKSNLDKIRIKKYGYSTKFIKII